MRLMVLSLALALVWRGNRTEKHSTALVSRVNNHSSRAATRAACFMGVYQR